MAWDWLIERNGKLLFHSSHGIPRISNRNIWSNGKRPWIFSILHVVVLEELWPFVLGTKQSVRIASVKFHSFGSHIYLDHFNVCRKPGIFEPGLAQPETFKLGCSK